MNAQNVIIADRHCTLVTAEVQKESCPTILCCMHEGLGTDEGRLEDAKAVASLMTEMTQKPFNLLCFDVSSWNRFLSPWPYENFTGEAGDTLSWISEQGIPYLSSIGLTGKTLIAGYSLAGLFALWAARSTDLFEGCASCSGSLWYPHWAEFSKSHPLKQNNIVYLSLGGKESKTSHPVISTIEVCTKEEFARIQRDPRVKKSTFEMNAGGHFTKTLWRLAKGMAWLVNGLG